MGTEDIDSAFADCTPPVFRSFILFQILQKDVCARCNPALPDSRDVNTYIRRCIEICWLMVVQDPPMVLDNTKPDQFDTARYRGYQHNGPYTAYIVWPAIRLHNDGPLLSKGVAEGTKSLTRPMEDQTFKQTGKSRPTDDRTTKQNNQMSNDMSRTWHPTRINVQNASEYFVHIYIVVGLVSTDSFSLTK